MAATSASGTAVSSRRACAAASRGSPNGPRSARAGDAPQQGSPGRRSDRALKKRQQRRELHRRPFDTARAAQRVGRVDGAACRSNGARQPGSPANLKMVQAAQIAFFTQRAVERRHVERRTSSPPLEELKVRRRQQRDNRGSRVKFERHELEDEIESRRHTARPPAAAHRRSGTEPPASANTSRAR